VLQTKLRTMVRSSDWLVKSADGGFEFSFSGEIAGGSLF